jgi:hypothetical protein
VSKSTQAGMPSCQCHAFTHSTRSTQGCVPSHINRFSLLRSLNEQHFPIKAEKISCGFTCRLSAYWKLGLWVGRVGQASTGMRRTTWRKVVQWAHAVSHHTRAPCVRDRHVQRTITHRASARVDLVARHVGPGSHAFQQAHGERQSMPTPLPPHPSCTCEGWVHVD